MTIYTNNGGILTKVRKVGIFKGGEWVYPEFGYTNKSSSFVQHFIADIELTLPNEASTINLQTFFESEVPGSWSSSKNKVAVINGSRGPVVVNSTFAGELTIRVESSGIISGIGGTTNSGVGGNALNITAGSGIKLINNGIIRGGGGGGGKGGTGGGGRYTTTQGPYWGSYPPEQGNLNSYFWGTAPGWNETAIRWAGSYQYWDMVRLGTSYKIGVYTYHRDAYVGDGPNGSGGWFNFYKVRRTYDANTDGGAGGNGGRGLGADGAAASGAAGSAGGTNAGAGGTGGNGGSWGTAGATGAAGANGNRTNGVAGLSGGTAGRSINGYNRVIYSGSGTLIGFTAST